MANPFGEKNIGPWEGQQVEYIPLDDLVLWTENPRDPLDGDYTNDDVIRRATDGRNEKQWQLSKLSKEMGDRFDLSELPTVCRIDDGPKYRVYDGNRRVILAMLRKAGLTTEGQQQLVPPDFPDPIPCNVCDEETALENVERKHRGNGSWKQYERDRFMFDYRGGPKTVLIRLEELIKAVTKWPALNMRYVEDDVFNKKHLEEMGLLPDGRERELPSDNSEPPSQSHGGPGRDDVLRPDTSGTLPHTDASARRRRGRTRQVKPASIPVFGNPSGLRLQTGDVNNMYRTLEELWNMYARGGMRNAAAFVPIFRMGLRLLIDTAAMERCGGLDRYVGEYAGKAKKRLRQAANSADLVTFMRNQAVSPENLLRLLQNGAHAYTSTGNKEQALAMSILIGEMLSISHGRP